MDYDIHIGPNPYDFIGVTEGCLASYNLQTQTVWLHHWKTGRKENFNPILNIPISTYEAEQTLITLNHEIMHHVLLKVAGRNPCYMLDTWLRKTQCETDLGLGACPD